MVRDGSLNPVTVEFNYQTYFKTPINGILIYTFFVKCDRYREMPLDPNPRAPDESREPYKEMKKTLIEEPEMFFLKNGGINVITDDLDINESNNKVTIKFAPEFGILNGGHTQAAILDTQKETLIDDKAIVRIEIIKVSKMSLSDIEHIAKSKNMTSTLKTFSSVNFQGYFDELKDSLKPEFKDRIIWYEGQDIPDGKGVPSEDIIAILSMFNVKEFKGSKHPTASSNAKSSVFSKWRLGMDNDTDSLAMIYPLANDIIELYEYIQSTCTSDVGRSFTKIKPMQDAKLKTKKETTLTKRTLTHNTPRAIIMPLVAAFRADIDEVDGKLKWIKDPKQVFDEIKKDLIENVTYYYNMHQNINKMTKDNMFWNQLYEVVYRSVHQ